MGTPEYEDYREYTNLIPAGSDYYALFLDKEKQITSLVPVVAWATIYDHGAIGKVVYSVGPLILDNLTGGLYDPRGTKNYVTVVHKPSIVHSRNNQFRIRDFESPEHNLWIQNGIIMEATDG